MNFSKRSALFILLGAVCALGLLFGLPNKTYAIEAGPDWISGSITVTKESDTTWTDGDQYTYGNIPCEQISAYSWGLQSNGWNSSRVKTAQNDCATAGSSAYIGWRQVLPFGSEYWQKLDVLAGYTNPWTYANPGTNGLALVTGAYGPYTNTPTELYYTDNILETFSQLSQDSAGNVIRSQSKPFDRKLTYPDGRTFDMLHVSGISYSANGRWMYVDAHIAGQLRIDTRDFSVLSFAQGYAPSYSLYTAISNSGNTIATHEYGLGLKLYDLTRCEDEKPDYGLRNCASRDVTQIVTDALKSTLADPTRLSWWAVKDIKFTSESQLRLFVNYAYNGQEKNAFFTVSTDAAQTATRYLALGDSFSSGEGAGDYYEATNFYADANTYNYCHQSRKAYSELLNSWIRPEFYDSIACSGAQMKDVVSGTAEDYANSNSAQARSNETTLDLVNRVKRSNLPGYIPQIYLVKENTANIGTVSIGGNDIGFKDIIMSCVLNVECYSSRDDREKLADLVASKIPKLASTFATIKQNMAGSNPKLYVLGYPRLFAERSCGQFMNIEEQAFANHLVNYLDDTIRLAAAQAGVLYVDVSHAFYDGTQQGDHRLCGEGAPAANGAFYDADNMTHGQPFLDGVFRALVSSYHPNALGHQLLASTIRLQTQSFTEKMPPRAATNERPSPELYTALVGDAFDSYQELGSVSQNITKDTVVEPGQSVSVAYSLGSADEGTPVENATITVVVQSTPVTLGTLTVQADGTTTGNFVLPENLEPGVHTLRLIYNDISGQSHDVYQYIYVIANENDFDGDGIPNSRETCVIGGAMGIDRDNNGIDDACDSEDTVATAQSNLANSELPVAQSNNSLGIVSRDYADSTAVSDLFESSLHFGATLQAPKSNADNDILEVTKDVGAKQDSSLVVYIILCGVLAMVTVLVIILWSVKHKRF